MYVKANSPHAATAGKSVIGFNLINGKEVEGDLSLIQSKSAVDTRDLVGMFPDSGEKDVARAAKAATEAFPTWSRTSIAAREAIVLHTAGILTAHRDTFARIITREVGMTPGEAQADIQATLDACAFFTDLIRPEEASAGSRRRPLGVCGVLATGSSPLAAPARKILPAILCGNTVVWKPSDNAPTAAYLLLRAMMEAGLPPGVVNTVNGRGRAGCGKHFLAGIDKGHFQAFSFVGSAALGRIVGEACGRNLIQASLDLLGKGSLVVLPDADLDRAAADAAEAAFGQAGQRLLGLGNLLVHEDCAAAFRQRFLDQVAALDIGNPLSHPEVAYGPMINARTATAFREHWDLGLAQGASLLTGGAQWTEANRTPQVKGEIGHGAYLQPCVWEGVTPDMGLFRHPVTGPTVNLCTFRDLDEALGWIADPAMGASVSLYTAEPAHLSLFQGAGRADLVRLNTLSDDGNTLLSFTGHGTCSGCQPVLDGFTRWTSLQGADGWPGTSNAVLPAASPLKTDWDSL